MQVEPASCRIGVLGTEGAITGTTVCSVIRDVEEKQYPDSACNSAMEPTHLFPSPWAQEVAGSAARQTPTFHNRHSLFAVHASIPRWRLGFGIARQNDAPTQSRSSCRLASAGRPGCDPDFFDHPVDGGCQDSRIEKPCPDSTASRQQVSPFLTHGRAETATYFTRRLEPLRIQLIMTSRSLTSLGQKRCPSAAAFHHLTHT